VVVVYIKDDYTLLSYPVLSKVIIISICGLVFFEYEEEFVI